MKQAIRTTLTEDFLKQGVTTVYEPAVTPAANGLYQEMPEALDPFAWPSMARGNQPESRAGAGFVP